MLTKTKIIETHYMNYCRDFSAIRRKFFSWSASPRMPYSGWNSINNIIITKNLQSYKQYNIFIPPRELLKSNKWLNKISELKKLVFSFIFCILYCAAYYRLHIFTMVIVLLELTTIYNMGRKYLYSIIKILLILE